MNRSLAWPALTSLLLAGSLASTPASAQVLDPIQYQLLPQSRFEWGCFGACACPIVYSGPMQGSFTFYRTSVDPLFEHYALLNIDWSFPVADGAGTRTVHVTGHGTYDRGGEVAVQERLTLDVSEDGGPTRHFVSAWTTPERPFPVIDGRAFLHGNECLDTVYAIVASPGGLAGVPRERSGGVIRSAAPNPTRAGVDVDLALAAPAHVRVDVLDLAGRPVARVLDADLPAGERRVRWSGLDERGVAAPPGAYWIRVRAGAEEGWKRVVRIR